MSLLLRLAFKNLTRHRRRTALTMVSIVAGVGIFILGEAFVSGVEENLRISSEEGNVGHLLVRPQGYPTQGLNAPLDRLLSLTPEARALLQGGAVAWAPRVLFSPTATHGSDSVRLRAIGYDASQDEKVFPRGKWKMNGRMPAEDANEVVVSPSVARLLNVKVDDSIVLQVRTHHGAMNALEVKVVGVVATGNLALDALGLFAPGALTQALTGADAPTHVSVKLARRSAAEAFKPKLLAAMGPQVEVATLEEETAEAIALQGTRRKALNVIVAILLALAGFGMANTFLMAAYERTREVGTLRAMGMTEGSVVALFVTEGTLVGIAGSLLGAAWGGGLAAWWSTHPLDFSAALEKTAKGGFALSALVYTNFSATVVVEGIAVGVLVAIASSMYPARVASALKPADAVRA